MIDVAPIWRPETQQLNYRVLLDAMARPGRVYGLHGTDQTHSAALATLATLLDGEVSLSDPMTLLRDTDWPMLQANSAAPDVADYVLCAGQPSPDFEPKLGSLPSPEMSATLVLVVDSLDGGDLHLTLRGPGIQGELELRTAGLNPDWIDRREDWVDAFPLGVDLVLTDATRVTALPRTTKLEMS